MKNLSLYETAFCEAISKGIKCFVKPSAFSDQLSASGSKHPRRSCSHTSSTFLTFWHVSSQISSYSLTTDSCPLIARLCSTLLLFRYVSPGQQKSRLPCG